MEVTTARILDKRRMLKKTKTYRLAIRVTYKRIPIVFPLDLHVSEDDFRKLSSPRIGQELVKIREKLNDEEQRAKRIIKALGTFTFDVFRREFYKDKPKKRKESKHKQQPSKRADYGWTVLKVPSNEGKNKKYGKRRYDRIRSNIDYEEMGPLAVAFGDYIKMLEIQERIGTSESYFSSLTCFLRFRSNLRLEDVTPLFLYEFENWMHARGNSITTTGIHVRNLRAIINLPANKKLFTDETYPFGRGKYIVPTGVNVKKALELWEIKKLYDYQPATEHKDIKRELFARDMWFFGFFANGINPKDIAHLKYSNIHDDDFITVLREKTRYTTRSRPRNIIIALNDDMRRVIKTWGNTDTSPHNYVFPVLQHGLSAHRRHELVQGFTAGINDWMKKIAATVGIQKKVRTMEYRHSMATTLKRAGASTEFIQEAMGHTDVRTTENYLDSFEMGIRKKYATYLLSFKDVMLPGSTVSDQL